MYYVNNFFPHTIKKNISHFVFCYGSWAIIIINIIIEQIDLTRVSNESKWMEKLFEMIISSYCCCCCCYCGSCCFCFQQIITRFYVFVSFVLNINIIIGSRKIIFFCSGCLISPLLSCIELCCVLNSIEMKWSKILFNFFLSMIICRKKKRKIW